MFQICRFVDEIVDSVYSRRDLLQLLDHSAVISSVPLSCDNLSVCCDNPMQSGPTAHGATADQHVLCDLESRNGDSPSVMHLPSRLTAYSTAQAGTESPSNLAAPSRQQSRLHNSVSALHRSSVNDFISQLNILLAPLSDFLTQHLAVLQTWLSCTSYQQLVVSLCRHIAEVDFIDLYCSLGQWL